MKATIRLKQADKQKVVLEALLKIVSSSSSLQALLKTKGVVFELANSTEVALVKTKFTIAKISGLSATETTVRLRDPKGDLNTFLPAWRRSSPPGTRSPNYCGRAA